MDRKIYCCFQFFNEVELLKLKLEELYNTVDYFIVSESTKTHSGLDKPLYFKENQHLFSDYSDHIIHQIIDDTPSSYSGLLNLKPINNAHKKIIDCVNNANWFDKNIESYLRDTYEKEMLFLPLTKCNDYDIIIIGDCDEIPNKNVVKEIMVGFDNNQFYHLSHDVFYYFLNLRKNEPWFGNIMLSFEKFKENSFCELRTNKRGLFIKDAGWHFSYMGGYNRVRHKIESFGEQSLNQKNIKDRLENNINNALKINRDLYNRPCKFWIEPITYKTHPQYLVENQDKFKHLIYKETN